MHDTEPDRPASGSVPHTFRLRMAQHWVPKMPPQLRRQKAFLYALATVAAVADTAGRTRWHTKPGEPPGRPLRLKELAAAMGSAEKDARRYLAAAIAAGVLTTEQAPQRGRTTVYVLLVPAWTPRWEAALSVLTVGDETPRAVDPHTAARGAGNGEASPVLDVVEASACGTRTGDGSPNSAGVTASQERVTVPRWRTGDGSPLRTGDGSPNTTRGTHDQPHEMVAVVPQVRDARGDDSHERAHDPSPPPGPPPLHAVPESSPGTRARGRTPAAGDRQPPLLMSVPPPARPAASPAHAPAYAEPDRALPGRETAAQPFGPPRVPWRALVAHERPDAAARVYRDRWTGDHAAYLPDPTGT
ncbi:hypothetical protein [Streptomyces sp. HGB0020]|uniref:hypothetical protein n=1 Tax=Streptomyces sp. HGB0020 TaxID=1078086 RepID=UPI00034E646D|nr:hypothetical protein [Streptomyces sp. HGB0020]EPD63154.1 hypothetical protein HMPREF1211_03495 [Streptomyces sp. HGB0020]